MKLTPAPLSLKKPIKFPLYSYKVGNLSISSKSSASEIFIGESSSMSSSPSSLKNLTLISCISSVEIKISMVSKICPINTGKSPTPLKSFKKGLQLYSFVSII